MDSSFTKLQWLHHLAVVQVVIIIINWNMRPKNKLTHIRGQITCEIWLQVGQAKDELMSHLLLSDLWHNVIRMSTIVFLELCDMLVKEDGLRPTL